MKTYLKTHKYLLSVLALPAYLLGFFLLERRTDVTYFYCHLPLDDQIPFCEWFVIPYLLWFGYLFFFGFYLMLKDKVEFLRYMIAVIGGMAFCLAICWAFPTAQALRPETFPRENLLTALVGQLYRLDTPTNVLPSMHVIAALSAHTAICRTRTGLGKPWIKGSSLVLCVLIVLSTMLIKQHSALDVIASLVVFVPLYICVFRLDLFFRKKPVMPQEAPSAPSEEPVAFQKEMNEPQEKLLAEEEITQE